MRRCINCQKTVEQARIDLLDSNFCAACATRIYAASGKTPSERRRHTPPKPTNHLNQLNLGLTNQTWTSTTWYNKPAIPPAMIDTVED